MAFQRPGLMVGMVVSLDCPSSPVSTASMIPCGRRSALPGEGLQETVRSVLASPLEKLGARIGTACCARS